MLITRASSSRKRIVKDRPVDWRRCQVLLELYPEEALLRVRIDGRTELLDNLTPVELMQARASDEGLREIVLAHLKARGFSAQRPEKRSAALNGRPLLGRPLLVCAS